MSTAFTIRLENGWSLGRTRSELDETDLELDEAVRIVEDSGCLA